MQKEICFTIDSDVYEKLTMALQLSGENQESVLESCVKSYIAKIFGEISEEYSPDKKKSVVDRDYTGKAIQRIPAWSAKPNQNNHKIIRAFFTAEDSFGSVTLDTMEKLCGDKSKSELYIANFKNNYAQMKLDGPKTYARALHALQRNVMLLMRLLQSMIYSGVRHQCGQPNVNLRQVPAQVNE